MTDKKTYQEGDTMLCTVTKIEGASVFVQTDSGEQGSLTLSEIAAGRIRNLRQYATVNKKIVCKVLRTTPLQLSLRRVTAGERQAVLDAYKQERNFLAVLKVTTKSPEKILEKIKSSYDLADFLDQAREDPKLLEKVTTKAEAEKIAETWKDKWNNKKTVKQELSLKTTASEGVKDIKEILNTNEARVNYLGSSRFEISLEADDFKTANTQLQTIIEKIREKAEKKHAHLTVKQK